MVFTISACTAIGTAVAAVATSLVILADADRGDHALALADIDDAYAARAASRDANAVDRAADQGAGVGDQHDLLALLDREGGHALPALGEIHQLDTFAAAAGDTVLVSRRALAEARRGHGEHELFL